jgi:ATP-dependent Clp protease adaptor protein ClpS
MDATNTFIARVAGLVMLLFGIASTGLLLLVLYRIFTTDTMLERTHGYTAVGLAAMAYFCSLVGYRLGFNRPNRHRSILPPSGWCVLGLLFVAVDLLAFHFLHAKITAARGGVYIAIAGLAGLCLNAGWRAQRLAKLRAQPDVSKAEEQGIAGHQPAAAQRGWQIGAIGGTTLFVHWSFAFGGLLASTLAAYKLPDMFYFWGLYAVLIIVHELGHVAAGRMLGLRIHSIEFAGMGGQCRIQLPSTTRAMAWLYAGGLLAQLAVLLLAYVLVLFMGPPTTPFYRCAYLSATAVNLVVLILSLVPATTAAGVASDGRVLWTIFMHGAQGARALFTLKIPPSIVFAPESSLREQQSFSDVDVGIGIEILNDDHTPMEFVVDVLQRHCGLTQARAVELMLSIHGNGGLLLPFPDRAQSVEAASRICSEARALGHPFVCRVIDAGSRELGTAASTMNSTAQQRTTG